MTRAATRARWRRWLRQWAERECSVAAFCAEKGTSKSSFYRWRRRLNGYCGTAKGGRGREASGSGGSSFLPVKVVEAVPVDAGGCGIEVALRHDRRIWIEPGFDEGLLRRAVRVLESC